MARSIHQLIESAREEISRITGLELGSTLSTAQDERGWLVSLEVVEKHSIPDQMDILAVYDVILDADAKLLEFNRRSLRKRVDVETEAVE